ncbi:hypothetical protein H920_02499 [Fukomys damarensis]|uniref:Uncharacterized protein n=1 Tax=Fukomys damarensis TaxID=885580 RepID=A0A091E0P8_FUKDA|nr:hypothetical protein H920_02499 [Fukomys damarensis]
MSLQFAKAPERKPELQGHGPAVYLHGHVASRARGSLPLQQEHICQKPGNELPFSQRHLHSRSSRAGVFAFLARARSRGTEVGAQRRQHTELQVRGQQQLTSWDRVVVRRRFHTKKSGDIKLHPE